MFGFVYPLGLHITDGEFENTCKLYNVNFLGIYCCTFKALGLLLCVIQRLAMSRLFIIAIFYLKIII